MKGVGYSIAQFGERWNLSLKAVRKEIEAGRLITTTVEGREIVLYADEFQWVKKKNKRSE